jgi:hypothetical protein
VSGQDLGLRCFRARGFPAGAGPSSHHGRLISLTEPDPQQPQDIPDHLHGDDCAPAVGLPRAIECGKGSAVTVGVRRCGSENPRADTPGRLLVISRRHFAVLLKDVPGLTETLLVTLSKRVRQGEERAERLGSASTGL